MDSVTTSRQAPVFSILSVLLGYPERDWLDALMRYEHTQHEDVLARLSKLTDSITLPAGACSTWKTLYDTLRQFSDALAAGYHAVLCTA